MPNPLSGLVAKLALALSAGAFFAFGIGFIVAKFDAMITRTDQRAYERGIYEENARWLAQKIIDRETADKAARERDAEIEANRIALETRARDAEKRANEALRKLKQDDPEFARCMALPYPSTVRRHLPSLLQ